MKAVITILLLGVLGIGFGQIRVTKSVQNMGDIFESSGKVTAKFKLQNPYREDTIRIIDIKTSCGCTAVLTEDTLILPLSTIVLDVSYDPKGRLGLFVKSIEITTKTGREERNKLFLKIEGNVVAEGYTVKEVDKELVEYIVAPIYFYPITTYDTSYLDFNYISSFVNDLSYEVDFYQFTTLGIEVEVPGFVDIEKIEYLLKYSRNKILREFKRRGFGEEVVFFDEPIFKKSDDLPTWASASVRLYSVNFDAKEATESLIRVTTNESVEETKMLLDYQRFAMPEIEDVMEQINFESIEGKLFLSGTLSLKGALNLPWKKSKSARTKFAKKLEKAIQKRIKKTTGAGKKQVSISFDYTGVHPDDKFQFVLWDEADEEEEEALTYVVKPDIIKAPLLPTYRQFLNLETIDIQSGEFQHFWGNIMLNYKAGYEMNFIIEYSSKNDPELSDLHTTVSEKAEGIKKELERLFLFETRQSQIEIALKTFIRGPVELARNEWEDLNLKRFDYFTIVPIIHNNSDLHVPNVRPFQVNFDYFFNGIDTGAWGFQRFSNYIISTIEKDGYVELRIESSISKIPVERNRSNMYLAYSRLLESERRLRAALSKRLVDPNRIIFTDERAIIQGPEYNGTIPVLKYREFHYLEVIPEKILKNRD